jgi:glycosyltransferase involved in cell wall biosynthesis
MNIVFLSDIGSLGSGYKTLTLPLAQGLAEKGHKVRVLGLEYDGKEHPFDLSLIPVGNFQEATVTLANLVHRFGVDIFIVALDIPVQMQVLKILEGMWPDRPFKYFGIFPVESNPLIFTWATELMKMDKRFVISQFGADECLKIGLEAEHLLLGIDTNAWRVPTIIERNKLRESFGYDDDTFVILTVAENQERKNLARAMEIFAGFNKIHSNSKYILVTREFCPVGWSLRDYGQELGINKDFTIIERGIDFKRLWSLYALADCFLLTSKAEGLGLPLLEAMAVGVPCVGTNCTAIQELLQDDRGYLIDYEYTHRDPFGNGFRYWANTESGVALLNLVHDAGADKFVSNARRYVESRNWSVPVEQLSRAVEEYSDDNR